MANEDILFNIKGDSSAAVSGMQSLIDTAKVLSDTLNKIGEAFAVFDQAASSVDNIMSAFRLAGANAEYFRLQVEQAGSSFQPLDQAMSNFTTTISAFDPAPAIAKIDELDTAVTSLSDSIIITSSDLDALGAGGAVLQSDLSAIPSVASSTSAAIDKVGASAADASSKVAQLGADTDILAQQIAAVDAEEQTEAADIDAVTASIDNAVGSTDTLFTSAGDLEKALAALLLTVKDVNLSLSDLSQQALTAASKEEDLALSAGNLDRTLAGQSVAMAATRTATVEAAGGFNLFGLGAEEAVAKSEPMNGLFGPDSMNLILMATAIGMAGGAFLKMGMDAQTAISHITGLADQSLALSSNSKQLQGYIDALGQSAMKYGINLTDAANGLYYIISAGFKTSDALVVLDSSMKAAAATGTQMDVVSNALTSILRAYSLSAGDAASVTDKMVQTVVQGKQEFTTFANAIGPVASAASHASISMEQMFAAEATLSYINPRIRQDGQNLANLFNTLSNNAQKVVDSANALGGHLTLASFQAMPLIDKLQTLAKIAGGDTTTAFRALLQNQTAATAAFNLLRDGGSIYNDILGKINHSQGALDVSFKQTSEDLQFGLNQLSAAISYISYQFVAMIGPVIRPILDQIVIGVQFLATHFQQLEPLIVGLATFLGVVLVGAVVALTGFMVTLGGPIIAIATAAGLVTTAFGFLIPKFQELQSWLNTTFPALSSLWNILQTIGNFVGVTLVMAWNNLVGALQNVEVWLGQHVDPALVTIINNLIALGEHIAVQVIPAMQNFINNTLKPLAAQIMANVVPALEKFVDNAMKLAVYISGHMPQILQQLGDDLKKVAEILLIVGGAFAGLKIAAAVTAAGGIGAFLSQAAAPLMAFLAGLPQAIADAAMGFLAFTEPFGLVIAVVVALIGYFIYLSTQSKQLQALWETLKGPLTDVWNALQQAMGDVVNAYNSELKPALSDLAKSLEPLMPAIKLVAEALGVILIGALGVLIEGLAAVIVGIGKFLAGFIQVIAGVINAGKDIIKMFWDLGVALATSQKDIAKAKAAWAQVGNDLKQIVKDFLQIIVGLWNMSFGAIFSSINQFVTGTIRFFKNLSDVLVGNSIVPDMLNKIIQLFQQFPQKVLQVIQGWVTSVIQWFQKLANQLVGHSIVPDMINAIIKAFQDLPGKVLQVIQQFVQSAIKFFQDFGKNAVQAMQTAMNGIEQAVSQGFQSVISAISQGIQNITQPFQKLVQDARQWGADFIKGFGDGIVSKMQGLLMQVMGLASSIAGYLHFSKPDVGPLADADTWGPDFGDLLATGLQSQVSKVGNAAKNIALSIQGAAPSASSFTSVISPISTNSEQTMVLRQILQELRNGNQAGSKSGYQMSSAELNALSQQFNYYNTTPQTANLYSQMNSLQGLANEYALRGSSAGLGF